MTTEDNGFFKHRGWVTSEFRTALKRNLQRGGFRGGASSITMQMVKNVLLSHEKTLSRKLQELFLVWYLEQEIPKERILELYFNAIEFGPRIYGIGPAARHYFGKNAVRADAARGGVLLVDSAQPQAPVHPVLPRHPDHPVGPLHPAHPGQDAQTQTHRKLAERMLVTTRRATVEFVEDRGHRSAAQMSFFAILSFIPLVLLLPPRSGCSSTTARSASGSSRPSSTTSRSPGDDRPQLEKAVGDALDRTGNLGIFTTLLVLAAASGVMGALRHSINEAWDIEQRPPLLQRKALDLALVLGGTSILALSVSLTVTHRLADILDDEAGGGWLLAALLDVAGDVLPLLFVAAGLLFLYRVLPMNKEPLRAIWPGAVVGALGLAVVKLGLELYFEQFADFGAIYGSLGAAMALLLFVFAAANVIVFGAEFASEWARADDGEQARAAESA